MKLWYQSLARQTQSTPYGGNISDAGIREAREELKAAGIKPQ